MNCVDIGTTMSPLNFFEKIPCPQRSVLQLLTRDWPISSYFWVPSCKISNYCDGKTSMFHGIIMFYFTKYSSNFLTFAYAGFHLVCNGFSLVVKQPLGYLGSPLHSIFKKNGPTFTGVRVYGCTHMPIHSILSISNTFNISNMDVRSRVGWFTASSMTGLTLSPRLVFILAGAVCNIWEFFWYIPTLT